MVQRMQSIRPYSRLIVAAVITAASMLAAGCRDADDRSGPSPPASGPAISGAVIAAHVRDSRVKAYKLRDDGSRDREIGTATTNAAGGFTMTLDSPPSGPIELEAVDGEYDSEADTRIKRTKVRLRALIPSVPAGGDSGLVATPLTTFAAARTMELKDSAPNLATAIDMGDDSIREVFGIGGDSLTKLEPDITATGDKAAAAVVLGALEDLAIKKSKEGADIVTALAADLSDGVPDGKKDETPVMFEGTSEVIPPTLGTSDFLASVTSYTDPNNDNTDRGDNPPPVDPDATAAVREGVVAAAPPSAGLSVGSSGAIASLAFDGKQVVYVAARGSGIKGLDITDPMNPTVDLLASLNSKLAALTPAFNDIGGVLAVPGAATPQVMMFDYNQSRVVVADVRDQTIVRDTDLSAVVRTRTSFSGGSAFVSGGIPDPTRGVIWLATTDGYIPYDIATFTTGTPISLQRGNIVSENIGGDVSSNLLFAPNYGVGFGDGALELVKLDERKSYVMKDSDFQTLFSTGGTSSGIPFGIVDAGSMDSIYKVGVLTGEDTERVGLIRLGDLGKFEFTTTPASGTTPELNEFAVKDSAVAVAFSVDNTAFPQYAGSAVESTNHLALLMAGFSNDILVAKLDDPASPTWKGFADWKQYEATFTEYNQAFDPHAVGTVLAAANSRSYGFMLSGNPGQEVLMIDMQAYLDAEALGADGDAAHRLKVSPFTNGIVRKFSVVAAAAAARSKSKQAAPVQRNYGYAERVY